jgi:hypothetical protein
LARGTNGRRAAEAGSLIANAVFCLRIQERSCPIILVFFCARKKGFDQSLFRYAWVKKIWFEPLAFQNK